MHKQEHQYFKWQPHSCQIRHFLCSVCVNHNTSNGIQMGPANSIRFYYSILWPSHAQLWKFGLAAKRRKGVLRRLEPINKIHRCNILFSSQLFKAPTQGKVSTNLDNGFRKKKKNGTPNSIQVIQSLGKWLRNYCLHYLHRAVQKCYWFAPE